MTQEELIQRAHDIIDELGLDDYSLLPRIEELTYIYKQMQSQGKLDLQALRDTLES